MWFLTQKPWRRMVQSFLLAFILLLYSSNVLSKIYFVNSSEQFINAVNNSKEHDQVVLEPGVYRDIHVSIKINNLKISSRLSSPAVIQGPSSFTVQASGVVLSNIVFDQVRSGSIVVFSSGDNSLIKNVEFRSCGNNKTRSRHLVRILPDASYIGVYENNFVRSESMSVGVVIDRDSIGGHHAITGNLFSDTVRTVENGLESIQIGQSEKYYFVKTYVTIAENKFDNVLGDDESISIKSSDNLVASNLFLNSSSLTLRGGVSNNVSRNCFIDNIIGVRVYGSHHTLYGNLFVSNMTAVYQHRKGGAAGGYITHARAEDISIVRNLFLPINSDPHNRHGSSTESNYSLSRSQIETNYFSSFDFIDGVNVVGEINSPSNFNWSNTKYSEAGGLIRKHIKIDLGGFSLTAIDTVELCSLAIKSFVP